MNRLLKTFLICIVVVGLSSCDLLKNQQPQQSLPANGALQTIEDFQTALVGAYNGLQTFEPRTNPASSAQLLFANDIIADDAVFTGSFPTLLQIGGQAMVINNSSIEAQWNGAYEAINSTNIILNALENANLEASQEAVNDIKGQALFIRALEYYYLVQYFAKPWGATSDNSQLGVPLQLDPVTSSDDFQKPSRSTVTEVYDQIISDLQTAQGIITTTTRNRATAGAATALLARIALIQQRWQDAADLSGQIIENSNYELLGDAAEYFRNELSSESIFEIQNTIQDIPDPNNSSITHFYFTADDQIQISGDYVQALNDIVTDDQQTTIDANNYTATDTRVSELLTGTTSTADVAQPPNADNTLKYEDGVNYADNLPILRLPEMILTRAEALAELNGINQESIDLLNQIRTRAINVTTEDGGAGDESLIKYTTSDFQNKQQLIDAILLERRVELAFEGHRKTDLQRRHLDVRGTPWDANNLVFPIPQSQTDANDNIEQNPGYGDQ